MPVIFARTSYFYQSYVDFWNIVELSGYPTVTVGEMDVFNPDNIYIISPMNGEMMDFMGENQDKRYHRRATLLHWNLERPDPTNVGNYGVRNQELLDMGYFDGVIHSDRYIANRFGFKYIPLGSHSGLGTPGSLEEKSYDVIHLSCYSNSRSWLFHAPDRPKEEVFGISIADNGWGESRDQNLRRSRMMWCTHQDGLPIIEPLRVAVAAAYGLPVISEYINDQYPYPLDCFDVSPGSLVWNTKRFMALHDKNEVYELGLSFRAFMTNIYSFRQCLEATGL